jgi:hypothetical protein
MKDHITVSIDINGKRGKVALNKGHLLHQFKAAQFFTNTNNPDYWLTIREFIRWKVIQDVYKGRMYQELREIGDCRIKNDLKTLTDWLKTEKLEKQLFIGKVIEIIGFDKANELLKESKEAIQKLTK